jgi:2Fe-2S ferredoxin
LINFIEADGAAHAVQGELGESVMEAARRNNIDAILADCGGSMSCATCHVHIDPAWWDRVGPPREAEEIMLELAIDPDETSRLSCQIEVRAELDGVVIHLPRSQL